jgi:hypothetical protein
MEVHRRTAAARLAAAARDYFFKPDDLTTRRSDSAVGWAVRRDWPDGSHDLRSFKRNETSARSAARWDGLLWRGLFRPRYAVVAVSRAEYDAHQRSGYQRPLERPAVVCRPSGEPS